MSKVAIIIPCPFWESNIPLSHVKKGRSVQWVHPYTTFVSYCPSYPTVPNLLFLLMANLDNTPFIQQDIFLLKFIGTCVPSTTTVLWPIHPSVFQSVSVSVCLSPNDSLFIHPSSYLSIYPSIYLSIHLSTSF